MAGQRFPGGLILARQPSGSSEAPRRVPLPARLSVPLSQHQGEPARPCVTVGQHVRKGQRIGEALGALSAHVHAPTSGLVLAIGEREIGHPSGRHLPCIDIEPDGADEWLHLPPIAPWHTLDRATIAARLHEAGVVGLGGGTFPTALKLADHPVAIQTLIINGVESEPTSQCDDALLRTRADDVLAGARLLAHALGATRIALAVDDSLHAAMAALRSADAAHDDDTRIAVELHALPARYPQGGERPLVQALTGIETRRDALPHQHGVVCVNVATAAAAWRAVAHGEPLLSRLVSVAGAGIARPCVLDVLLGTPIAALIDAAGGYRDDATRLVLGGVMMGQALPHDDIPIGKGSFCVNVLARHELPAATSEMPCIRCGECARVCPPQLLPQRLLGDIRAGDWPAVERQHLRDCIECGLCEAVCPSHIPLLPWLLHGKGELAHQQREQALSARSRRAHAARAQRLDVLAEERRQRLSARERGTGNEAALPSVLAAALAKARAGKPVGDEGGTP